MCLRTVVYNKTYAPRLNIQLESVTKQFCIIYHVRTSTRISFPKDMQEYMKQNKGNGLIPSGSLKQTMRMWAVRIEPRPSLRPTLHRTLPSAWLDTSSSFSHPLVHSNEVSSWLPELRTLALGGNDITMPAYDAIQSVIGFASLQVLDLSGNALSGNMEHSFDLNFCEGGNSVSCDSTAISTGASDVVVLLLASNRIDGGLDAISLPGSLSVLTVSDNLLHGPVPVEFSQLSVFMAGERR